MLIRLFCIIFIIDLAASNSIKTAKSIIQPMKNSQDIEQYFHPDLEVDFCRQTFTKKEFIAYNTMRVRPFILTRFWINQAFEDDDGITFYGYYECSRSKKVDIFWNWFFEMKASQNDDGDWIIYSMIQRHCDEI